MPSHIVRRLAQRGETVVSYDLMPVDDLLRDLLGDSIENVVFAFGDVTDADGLILLQRGNALRLEQSHQLDLRAARHRSVPRRRTGEGFGKTGEHLPGGV